MKDTLHLNDHNDPVFNLVWTSFDDSVSNQTPAESVAKSVCDHISQLDLEQVQGLLKDIHSRVKSSVPNSVKFALLLNFKRVVLDAILSIWKLSDLRPYLDFFHPMECVYLILNSSSVLNAGELDVMQDFFGENYSLAYRVFMYIVLWINWKVVDPSEQDEKYYDTYFVNYSKGERKRVMSSMGSAILKFVASHPDAVLTDVVKSFKDIVPLLDMDQLVVYWTFFKLLETNASNLNAQHHIIDLFSCLSKRQLEKFALWQIRTPTPTSATTPTPRPRRASVSKPYDDSEWESLAIAVLGHMADSFTRQTSGSKNLLEIKDTLIEGMECVESLENGTLTQVDSQFPISSFVRVLYYSSIPWDTFSALLQIEPFSSTEMKKNLLKVFVIHCSLFSSLGQRGIITLNHLGKTDTAILHDVTLGQSPYDYLSEWTRTLPESDIRSEIEDFLATWNINSSSLDLKSIDMSTGSGVALMNTRSISFEELSTTHFQPVQRLSSVYEPKNL